MFECSGMLQNTSERGEAVQDLVLELGQLLGKKDRHAFDSFLDALREDAQAHIAAVSIFRHLTLLFQKAFLQQVNQRLCEFYKQIDLICRNSKKRWKKKTKS